jgi:heme/copper-type cytochrome/quinol oxidase subunit 3
MIKETLTFLSENSCSESSILVLETLILQSSSITLLLTSHKHRAQAYKQANKQERLRTDTSNKKKALKERTKG